MIAHKTFIAAVLSCAFGALLPVFAQQSAPSTSTNRDAKTKTFVHPGLLHTQSDFARMKQKVADRAQPWSDGWTRLTQSRHAQLNWQSRPTPRIVRGNVPGQNVVRLFNDVHAAYQLALRWKISGEVVYAGKAVEIMNAWSNTLQEVNGNSDRFLAAGIYGYQLANAAEIMRDYEGWKREDFARFQGMMLKVFAPMNRDFLTNHNGASITNYWANWDLCNIASLQAIGVLCDRRDVYDEAMTYFRSGRGNGALDKAIYYRHPGNLGQWQEAGRDQGHTTLGIALMGPILETAWHQGEDLYSYDNNSFLAGAEYVAKYNLGLDVPFQSYAWGLGQKGERREQNVISPAGRGHLRAGFELVLNHYAHRKGIAAPYSAQYAAKLRPEGGAGGHASSFDQFGFGTLTHTLEPQVLAPKPTGLTARKSGQNIVLSWWGIPDATVYQVQRATKINGPYISLASNVRDVLTFTDALPTAGNVFYRVSALREGKPNAISDVISVNATPHMKTWLSFAQINGTAFGDFVNFSRAHELNGGATWVKGKTGGALELNGRDGFVALPPGIVRELSDFSIATWVKLNAAQPWARLFDFGDERGRYLFLTPNAGNGKPQFSTSTVYGYNEQRIDGSQTVPVGQWIHLAVTLSGRLGTLYLNGEAVGSNPNLEFPPFQIGNTSRNWIGRSQLPNDPHLNGSLDDFRIYDGALSNEQIKQLAETARD